MIRRQRHEESTKVPLAPMIDMVFLLLVFFMVTTRITNQQKKVELQLPKAKAALIPENHENREVINIDAQGQFYAGDRLVTLPELKKHLQARLAAHPPLKIFVRADYQTPAKPIKTMMQTAAEAGAVEVIFAAYSH